MIEYPQISPVIPGNEVDGWQAIRKKQWKYVKRTLEEAFDFDRYEIKHVKDTYYLSDTFPEDDQPAEWEPRPILPMWLCANQSDSQWDEIWNYCLETYRFRFDKYRDIFIKQAHIGEDIPTNDQVYGAFGGMEQRLLAVFVQSQTYTDDTFKLGNKEYRKIPWKSPFWVHSYIFGSITRFFDSECISSPFSPYQWLHNLFVSTFSHDIEYNEVSDKSGLVRLTNLLNESNDELWHPNHIQAGRTLIDILEDSTSPKYLRDLWNKVRKERGF